MFVEKAGLCRSAAVPVRPYMILKGNTQMRQSIEEFRKGMLHETEEELARQAERVRELHRELNALEAKELALIQRLRRANSFVPDGKYCPRCAIEEDVRTPLLAIDTGVIVVNGVAQAVGVLSCNRCGWDDLQS